MLNIPLPIRFVHVAEESVTQMVSEVHLFNLEACRQSEYCWVEQSIFENLVVILYFKEMGNIFSSAITANLKI